MRSPVLQPKKARASGLFGNIYAKKAQTKMLCANDLTSLQALGADVRLANMAVVVDGNFLYVWAERAIRHAM